MLARSWYYLDNRLGVVYKIGGWPSWMLSTVTGVDECPGARTGMEKVYTLKDRTEKMSSGCEDVKRQ